MEASVRPVTDEPEFVEVPGAIKPYALAYGQYGELGPDGSRVGLFGIEIITRADPADEATEASFVVIVEPGTMRDFMLGAWAHNEAMIAENNQPADTRWTERSDRWVFQPPVA